VQGVERIDGDEARPEPRSELREPRQVGEISEAEAPLTPNGVEARPQAESARIAEDLARERTAPWCDDERLLEAAAVVTFVQAESQRVVPERRADRQRELDARTPIGSGKRERKALRRPVLERDLELRIERSERRRWGRAQSGAAACVLAPDVHRLDHPRARIGFELREARFGLGLARARRTHRRAERLPRRVARVSRASGQVAIARGDSEVIGQPLEFRTRSGAHVCGTRTSAESGGRVIRSECAKPCHGVDSGK
jgi:hypothetical protein